MILDGSFALEPYASQGTEKLPFFEWEFFIFRIFIL